MLALRSEEYAFQLTGYIGISVGRRQCQIARTYPVQVWNRCRGYENYYRSLLRKVVYRIIIMCRKL